jgi:hypothetical protein
VPPSGVVPAFDPVEDREPGVHLGAEAPAIEQLALERGNGLGDLLARGAVAAGATPISKAALGLPVLPGASAYTNPISYFGFKVFPGARLPFQVLGTNRVFGALGRLNPWIGGGLLAYDTYSVGTCVSECMSRGYCQTEGQ